MDLMFNGIKMGLVLCFMIGPVFFTLLQTAVEEGFRAAATVGAGIWASDIGYIILVYFGLSFFQGALEFENRDLIISIFGTVVFIIFGLVSVLTSPKNLLQAEDAIYKRSSSYFSLFVKGLLLNLFNPFTIVLWGGFASSLLLEGQFTPNNAALFFGGVIGTVIITDLLKIVLSKRIRRIIRPKHLIWIRKGTGFVLLAFGIGLAVHAVGLAS